MPSLPSHVIIGTDHAGFSLKQALVPLLKERGIFIEDLSPFLQEGDDYPLIAHEVAKRVEEQQGTVWGIVLCGSGIGASIEANRHNSIRAALVRTPEDARTARFDDHANVLALGGRVTTAEELPTILDSWINTEPSTEARHLRRIAELDQPLP